MSDTAEIELAPAAGSGIGKLLAAALLAKPDLVSGMVAVIDRGFNAQKRFWNQQDKCWECDADGPTQIKTLALVLAHMEGEPIKRIIHQHLGGTGAIDPLAALQESPALRDAARRLLEKADWRTSGHQAHKRPEKSAPAVLEVD